MRLKYIFMGQTEALLTQFLLLLTTISFDKVILSNKLFQLDLRGGTRCIFYGRK